MKKYLSELHNKPESHKKRFALLVSGTATLLIFAIWSFVKFGGTPEVTVAQTGPVNLAAVQTAEVGIAPFDTILRGIGDAWQSLSGLISNGQ